MRIGFDAKRAFFNYSGLGNYSRNTILYLNQYYPENEYFLYIPRKFHTPAFSENQGQQLIYPDTFLSKLFPSLWRSYLLPGKLDSDKINLYHGLSNEIPFGIHRHKISTVVTIHDLIFLRFPQWYKQTDRSIYKIKTQYSCKNSDRIIAISNQTKADIIEFYQINPDKIDVVYQGCDPQFYQESDASRKKELLIKYNLKAGYLLYVGTIEKRKNLLNIVKALHSGRISETLVVIGRQTRYADLVKKYITSHQLRNIRFLENVPNQDLPSLYQMASLFIYPSIYEGFGIPILEALYSRIPVITTSGGCFREAGGDHSIYIDPADIEQISDAIKKILKDNELRKTMISRGYDHALRFNDRNIARTIMDIYRTVTVPD